MTILADPLEFPQIWDNFLIGDVESPGICEVTGASRKYEWNVSKSQGAKGATITHKGQPPVEFKIKIKLWISDHFVAWDAFRPLLRYDSDKAKIKAVDILHPATYDCEIYSVVCADIGQLTHEGGGCWSVTISFLEYFPPVAKNVTATPTSSTTNATTSGAGTQATTADDDQQKEIARLLAIAAKP